MASCDMGYHLLSISWPLELGMRNIAILLHSGEVLVTSGFWAVMMAGARGTWGQSKHQSVASPWALGQTCWDSARILTAVWLRSWQ